ncbi:MAG: DUF3141 domain-containing protein [Phyllobacterium sp.]|uniref:DUF3141 domain-containing protein n=1 Tax=Phyllobacterium sp. TaxID=1871046 RepID=UPI0030F19AEC
MLSELSSVTNTAIFDNPLTTYWTDAWQRSILFLDVMRRRGAQYEEQAARTAPHVLDYEAELLCDGRSFARPVNYALVRIVPPPGVAIDGRKRPFVVVDPRAGHGPGIGGFKADSEIGVAMKAGHACYFVGFLPEPVPGQTIEDIIHAQAMFLEMVIARHLEADGKPCVIGNCQAGWAVMMLASLRPDLFGPIIIAGTPLSYWAGVKGQYPMRYSGGLLGGSWLTALTGDLGAGKFDGAWLVQNFENQNPANTLWSKQYNLYSRIDTEAERYLGFERWWGGHVTLNAEEMQFIVDELFIGNKLACGQISTSTGTAIDLRNIRSPILIFCSKGDNITPPQQALDWILDLYDSVDEIRSLGQTIIYTVHETIGHLGIFVSAGVARKEHDEFASNIDLIDVLPPGLYEAILEPRGEAVEHPELVTGQWVMRCEARTLDDIRALGGNEIEDEHRFAAAAQLSDINLSCYRIFAQPFVRAAVTPQGAEAMRQLHPLRLSYEMFSPRNPLLAWVEGEAELVRKNRRTVEADNPFLIFQEQMSRQILDGLDGWRKISERLAEATFRVVYGAAPLQAALGIDPASRRPPRKALKNHLSSTLLETRIAALKAKIMQGGLLEGLARSLIFVALARGRADERGFEAIRRIRQSHDGAGRLTLAEFKTLIREQYFILLIDEPAALGAIPALLPADIDERRKAFELLREILDSSGALQEAASERLERVAELFSLDREGVDSNPVVSPASKAARVRSVS